VDPASWRKLLEKFPFKWMIYKREYNPDVTIRRTTVASDIGYNLRAYYMTDLSFNITASNPVDILVILNWYDYPCRNLGSSHSSCVFVSGCSCLASTSCVKTCLGLDSFKSYSILVLRYNSPSAIISGTYRFNDLSNTGRQIENSSYSSMAAFAPISLIGLYFIYYFYQKRRSQNQEMTVHPTEMSDQDLVRPSSASSTMRVSQLPEYTLYNQPPPYSQPHEDYHQPPLYSISNQEFGPTDGANINCITEPYDPSGRVVYGNQRDVEYQ
jgi:hypothetical protein